MMKLFRNVYLYLIYLTGILALTLITKSTFEAQLNPRLLEVLGNVHFSILLLYIFIIILFYRYLIITVGKVKKETHDFYNKARKAYEASFEMAKSETIKHYKQLHKLLLSEDKHKVLNYLQSLMCTQTEHIKHLNDGVINPAIRHFLDVKFQQAKDKGVMFYTHVTSKRQLDFMLTKDIVAILGNLIDNAIRAASEVDEKLIRLDWHEENSSEVLVLENTGHGIPQQELQRIFDLGYTTKKNGEGGSGLAIVMKLVRKYQGNIRVESDQGIIRFILTF
jgi:sensor histidine kinase regulating citrate/malate metabolism